MTAPHHAFAPGTRSSVYYNRKNVLLIKHWLSARDVAWGDVQPTYIEVRVRNGEFVRAYEGDIITHVVPHNWVEVFS